MSRRRLLFVSPRFLFPSDSGGKIRTRDILRGLKGGTFDITLASPALPRAQERFAAEIERVCDRFVGWPETPRGLGSQLRRLASIASPLPVSAAVDRSAAGRSAVEREIARGCDLVVADFPHASVLLPERLRVPGLLFTHNVEAEIFRRHASVAGSGVMRRLWADQARKMTAFERAAARRFDAVVAVSSRDAAYFREIVDATRVFVIPTGVDLDYFAYAPLAGPVPAQGGTLVFTGSMDWLANVDGIRYFMDEVWPRVVAARPAARMIVVGHSPPRDLVQAAKDRGLDWTFTGFVDDVRVPVRGAHVYVIPLRVGGGTRIKAFEAMASGCPIVTTSIGVEGLPVDAGTHCLVGDTADSFAAAALRLLDDEPARRAIAEAARRLVETRFSFRAAATVFESACVAALASAPGEARSASVASVAA